MGAPPARGINAILRGDEISSWYKQATSWPSGETTGKSAYLSVKANSPPTPRADILIMTRLASFSEEYTIQSASGEQFGFTSWFPLLSSVRLPPSRSIRQIWLGPEREEANATYVPSFDTEGK